MAGRAVLKAGFTDMHSHFAYGLDDGAKTFEQMCSMLDAAQADGISNLVSTPHVTPGIEPFDESRYADHISQAREYCLEKNYQIEIYTGAEILYTPAMYQYMQSSRLPTIADGDQLLIEFTPDIAFRELAAAVETLERAGYFPVLAHIERYDCFFHGFNFRSFRKGSDALCQVNAETVIDGAGFKRDQYLKRWFRDGLVDIISSDAHNCTSRPFRMREAYEVLCEREGEPYADELTHWEVPVPEDLAE